MVIVVTGAAGFIGWKVSELLLEGGHTVVGVDNLNDAYDPRLKEWRLGRLQGCPGFHFGRLDITDRATLWEFLGSADVTRLGEPDAVINLAARAGVRQSLEDPYVYVATNVTGTVNLLEWCREQGVSKFVLASTSSLYAHARPPFSERASTDRVLSPYAASKKGAEAMAYVYHHIYGTDVTILRYFTVYGPAGRPDMSVFRFVRWIAEGDPLVLYGDGSQQRDFTYVEDIARGTVLGLRSMGFRIINLGSDRPVALKDIITQLEGLLGRPAVLERRPMHPADVTFTWADISRARKLLGWEPTTPIEAGLENAVKWYQENRAWARDLAIRME